MKCLVSKPWHMYEKFSMLKITELKLHFYQSKHKNGISNIPLVHH